MTDTINPETHRWAISCEECGAYAVMDKRPTDADLRHGCVRPARRMVEKLETLTPDEINEMLGCGRCAEITAMLAVVQAVNEVMNEGNEIDSRIEDAMTALPETVTDQMPELEKIGDVRGIMAPDGQMTEETKR